MNSLLICPGIRENVSALTSGPLACAPLLGSSPLEYWLEHLALQGASTLRILAHDRPDQVAEVAGDGARWGLQVEVIGESTELSLTQARLKYAAGGAGWLPAPYDVVGLDRLPGGSGSPLFENYAGWYAAVTDWIPHAQTAARVGMKEIRPGIWVSRRARISTAATLRAPCWIGARVRIEADATVGPFAVIEDGARVESGAEVAWSIIGPDTFVGGLCGLRDALAIGNNLVCWRDDTRREVADAFLLCSLRDPSTTVAAPDRQETSPAWWKTTPHRALLSNAALSTK